VNVGGMGGVRGLTVGRLWAAHGCAPRGILCAIATCVSPLRTFM
jgi:hypothetical protein